MFYKENTVQRNEHLMMTFKGSRLSGSQVLWHLAHGQTQAISQKDTDKILSESWLRGICFNASNLILNYSYKLGRQFTPVSIFPLILECQAGKPPCLNHLLCNTYFFQS